MPSLYGCTVTSDANDLSALCIFYSRFTAFKLTCLATLETLGSLAEFKKLRVYVSLSNVSNLEIHQVCKVKSIKKMTKQRIRVNKYPKNKSFSKWAAMLHCRASHIIQFCKTEALWEKQRPFPQTLSRSDISECKQSVTTRITVRPWHLFKACPSEVLL